MVLGATLLNGFAADKFNSMNLERRLIMQLGSRLSGQSIRLNRSAQAKKNKFFRRSGSGLSKPGLAWPIPIPSESVVI
ncbi:hypothetical protein MTR_6g087800 [Medicago truncatula]|uniref:Uncharacterized protein n=1 Tax=Medicago truncatula TaxID=3880 RepID=G7KPE6_MEDTR|nr:hypothetical protein MTR_6g087800 [Medicago truncatula]